MKRAMLIAILSISILLASFVLYATEAKTDKKTESVQVDIDIEGVQLNANVNKIIGEDIQITLEDPDDSFITYREFTDEYGYFIQELIKDGKILFTIQRKEQE